MVDARQAVADLFAQIRSVQKDVNDIKAGNITPQLGRSSLDNTSIPVYDSAGLLRMRIGLQGDGTFGLSAPTASQAGVPTTPVLSPAVKGLRVAWDGCLVGGFVPPTDFSHVEVHVSDDADFNPNADTLHGVLYATGSVTVAPLESVLQYVRLVGINASGEPGEPSDYATATPGEVVAEDVLDGIVTTVKLAEGAVTDAKIAAGAVTETKIADDSISTPKIVAGAIQAESIAVGAVQADAIAASAVTAEKIAALSITADKVAANAITAGKIDAGAVTAGTIEAGAVTANTLESQLNLASEIIAGDPDGARLSLTGDGLLAYNAAGTPTLSVSGGDGSIQLVGGLQTDITGAGWSIGPGGLFVQPGSSLAAGPIGNTAQQVAWQDESALYAFIEARTDGSLQIQNNTGDTVLTTGPGGVVRVQGSDASGGNVTSDGLVLGRTPSYVRAGDFSTPITVGAGGAEKVISLLSVAKLDTGDLSWDDVNSGITIPQDGIYSLWGSFVWDNDVTTGYRQLSIFNSTQNVVLARDRRPMVTTFMEQQVSGLASLSAGDVIQLRAYLNGSTNSVSRSGYTAADDVPPATLGISFVGWQGEPAPSASRTLIVHPIATDSYQYGSLNAWRSGDYVYQGNGGGGNHRGMFFYGAGAFAELEGKVIDKVTMYIRRSAAEGSDSAVSPHLRAHVFATSPAPAAPAQATTYPDYGLLPGFKKGTYQNIALPTQVATDLSGDTWNGLMFETTGSGFSRWTGHSDTANGTLTITYHDAE